MNTSTNPHVSIIILNWNGWKDTIECLESVCKLSYTDFNIILIDNNSEDDSLNQLKSWANGKSKESINTRYPQIVRPPVTKPIKLFDFYMAEHSLISGQNFEKRSILLVENRSNLGFAQANNQGMTIAAELFKSNFYFLLNNDTIIEKNALSGLVRIMMDNRSIKISQPTIYSYETNKIVNAGGKILFWGQTRYYKSIGENEIRDISFINGCALLVRAEIIREYGKLSDKFFHGEEDFELSLRMNRYKQRMICSGKSRIYHKVGTSVIKMMTNYERIGFLFALNRIVNLKDYYPRFIWIIWRIPTLYYFGYLFWIKNHVPLKRTIFLLKKIHEYTDQVNDVKKATIEAIYTEINF